VCVCVCVCVFVCAFGGGCLKNGTVRPNQTKFQNTVDDDYVSQMSFYVLTVKWFSFMKK
jgi:hypothetical protein